MGDSRLSRRLRDLRPYIQQSLSSLIAAHSAGTGMWDDSLLESIGTPMKMIAQMPDGKFYTRQQLEAALNDLNAPEPLKAGTIVTLDSTNVDVVSRYSFVVRNKRFMVITNIYKLSINGSSLSKVPAGYARVTDGERTFVFQVQYLTIVGCN